MSLSSSISLCNVQSKLQCLYHTIVVEEKSKKRPNQPFKVIASDELLEDAKDTLNEAMATEKLDGTSCYINEFQGRPWMWPRRDRRPTKVAEKRFRKFQEESRKVAKRDEFRWNVSQDFKEVPPNWIPAEGMKQDDDGNLIPDVSGHISGWMPIDPSGRLHCWHLTALDLHQSYALVLRSCAEDSLEITAQPLSDLLGRTMELIGTHVNANPYKLGTKNHPIHLLVEHGVIPLPATVSHDLTELKTWFKTPQGQVEGIVWHCRDGIMFKLHRHHVNLLWPVPQPRLSQLPVVVSVVDVANDWEETSNFKLLASLGRVTCRSLTDITTMIESTQSLDK